MENLDNLKNFWKNKKVFITGHTGFKGSWLSIILAYLESTIDGYSLKPEKKSLFNKSNIFKSLRSNTYADINNIIKLKKKILTSESNTGCQKNFLKENLLFKNYLLHNLNSEYSKIYNCALLNIENIYSSFSEKNFKHVSSKFNNIKYLEISKKIKNFLEKNDVIKYSKIKKMN